MFKFFLFFAVLASHGISSAEAVRVGLSDVPPFSYEKNGKFQGLNYDIFQQLAAKSGLDFKYEIYPHIRLSQTLPSADVDLVLLFSPSCLQHKNEFEIITTVYSLRVAIYVRTPLPSSTKDLKIGRLLGTCTELMKEYVKPENVYNVSDMDQAIHMIESGRLDGVCGLAPVLKYALVQSAKQPLKLLRFQSQKEAMDAVLCRRRTLRPKFKGLLENAAKGLNVTIPDAEAKEISSAP